ncbi:MAG: type I restriction enzyme HsdR N-terminal domain-containing protein [Bacteroidales bacterium]|nr:type I restriction enzyme HsdR N-terminal domain-containing protein [Bacteroidales bacterium]
MFRLNLPPYPIKIQEKGEKRQIFDFLRRKWVALTPEEWVRQHFTHYLVEHKGYPKALLANEVELRIGEKRLRCDTLLYNRELRPRMIIEYKAPHIQIQQKTFDHIVAYNLLLHADFLVISNGLQHYCCQMDYERRSYRFLTEIPDYTVLRGER